MSDPERPRPLEHGPTLALPPGRYRWFPGQAVKGFEFLAGIAGARQSVRFESPSEYDETLHPGALLALGPGAWWVIDGPEGRRGVAASRGPGEGAPQTFVALLSSDEQLDWPTAGDADWEAAPETTIEAPLAQLGEAWASGPLRAAPHPLLAPGLRDWSWAWRSGPSMAIGFQVELEATPGALRAWLESLAPLPYGKAPPHDLAAPVQGGQHFLDVNDSLLRWSRDWREPQPQTSEVDSALLWALAQGAFPVREWLAIDDDYGVPMAVGETAASLRDYLDARIDPAALRAEMGKRLAPVEVPVRTTERAEILRAVLSALRAPAEVPPEPEAFATWLAAQPPGALPRRLSIRVPWVQPRGLDWKWWFELVARASACLFWSVTEVNEMRPAE